MGTTRRVRLIVTVWFFASVVAACGGSAGGTTGGSGSTGATTLAGNNTGGTAATTSAGSGTGGTAATTSAGNSTGGAAATTSAGGGTGGAAATTSAGANTGSGGTTARATLPADCGTVALQFWNPFTGPDGPFMVQMVDAFNAANPNIQVTVTSQSEYYTQLTTAAASRALPEVAIVHADRVATQAFLNVIRPLGNIEDVVGVQSSEYPEPVWTAGEVNGQRYAIPLDIHPLTMFYNEDLMQAANVSGPPTNAQEFEQAAAAMTSGSNKGFMVPGNEPSAELFSTLLYQNGGSWFNQDGTQATWNSPEGVEALQWLKDAQTNYSEPNLEVDADINAFKAGSAGIVWNGIWQTTNLTGQGVEFASSAAPVPQIFDKPAVWVGSHQLALTVQPNPDPCKDTAAGIFMKYLVDNSVTWAKGGQIPANSRVRSSAEFQAVQPQATVAPSVEGAFFPPTVPGIADALVPLEEAVYSVMSGATTDIKAALDQAASRANQILEQNRSSYGSAPKS